MIKRVFALTLIAVLCFSLLPVMAAEPIEEFVWWESTGTRELESFLLINSEKAADHNVLCNAFSALLETDNKGRLVPAIAKEWGTSDNGLTWTFKLRDDVVWVDVKGNEKAKCNAQDWITSIEWILNFHKNGANNTSMLMETLKGAEEYYNYTKALPREEAMALAPNNAKLLETVGIEAPDDYTLVYHCFKNAPYFDTLCVGACLFPLSQAMVEELGVENVVGMNNENMWYNGPYLITEYIQNNRKELTPNPKYWDKDAKLFKRITILMISDTNQDDQLFETGEVDQCEPDEATLRAIWNDKNHPYHNYLVEKRPRKYSYQIHLNFAKRNPDTTMDDNWNKAAANENFRKSLYYGLDLMSYWSNSNFIYPTHCENLTYTMKGFAYFSDGTDYVDRVIAGLGLPEGDGTKSRRYNAEKAAEYVAKAKEELTAQGVTFPIKVDYYIKAGSQSVLDRATLLREAFEAVGGPDYVNLNICTYVSSLNQEVILPKLQSFNINGWGADYGDPENFMSQEMYGNDRAYYSNRYSNINMVPDDAAPELIAQYKEYTRLVEIANNIYDDTDKRYQAYVDAEIYMLDHVFSIPCYLEVVWQLTKVNDYSKMECMFGSMNYTYKNWETSSEPYTTADYERLKAAFEASK